MGENIRVLFTCTGAGVINRGIESFFTEAYNGLKNVEGIESRFLVGKANANVDEKVLWQIPRVSKMAEIIGKATGRTPYAVEQWSAFPAVVKEIKSFRPHIIFSSEANLFFLLNKFRSLTGVPYKLLFSNGGPCGPPFNRFDFVHQVAPYYKHVAVDAGESEKRHIMVPYGIHVPKDELTITQEDKRAIRRKLNLPENRMIVISVGWISAGHKRMDYTIREVASLPKERRPFLLMLGNIDQASAEIFALAKELLDDEDYTIKSVPYKEVPEFYKAADIFVLSSLQEGFGRVYLEALMYNLPVIAHRHPVMQYVVGDKGILEDLEQPGNLAKAIERLKASMPFEQNGRKYVRDTFDWQVLAPKYKEMFKKVVETNLSEF